MTREPLSIQETGGKASYYLMQGQDRLAIVIPLSESVYGPEIVGELLNAMCELTNESQDDIETLKCPECPHTVNGVRT